MKQKLWVAIAVLYFGNAGFAQIKQDTMAIQEVVVTGQYNPQSIKKSLYKVDIITQDDIARMAVNNVAEVLSRSLNILIIPTKNSGDSKAEILGLGADYTKILIDNIPVIGDTGLGSNIDLTKISLNNIERIEIVKGSMGVEFGNNAIAGVINIITKKKSLKKWDINGFIQEETVGKEYDWINYGKGRHVQSLSISHNISERWYAGLSLNRNDFQGFRGIQQGKNYFETDGLRGYEWQPKEQWNPAFMLRYAGKKTQLFYKADYLSEEINYYNPVVEEKYLGAGERTFIASDRNYFTNRMLHHLNIRTDLFKTIQYTGDFSYQKQNRKNRDYSFDIPARSVRFEEPEETYFQAETFYSRGTLSNFTSWKNNDMQAGYEGDFTRGFAGMETGSYDGHNIIKEMMNIGIFASAEFQLPSDWFLRPGFRINLSDTYEAKPNFSLVLKNRINPRSEFRAIVGSANKNPTFEELFTWFVDVNHDIRGNATLKPENSYSGTLFYTISGNPHAKIKWALDLSTMYLQTEDRIELAVVNEVPLQYQYINVETYQSWMNMVSAKISAANAGLSAGFSVLGRMMNFDSTTHNNYLYSTEINASGYYTFNTGTTVTVNFRNIGKSSRLTEDKSLKVTQYILKEQNAFSLMDASISQQMWKKHFTFTIGVRNLLAVTNVLNSGSSAGGAHSSGTTPESMFYGRSFFARLNFNF